VLISRDLNPERLKRILSPLFTNTDQNKAFNPYKALEPQRVKSETEEERESIDLEAEIEQREKNEREEKEKRDQKVMTYLEAIVQEACDKGDSYLSAALGRLDENAYKSASFDFDFYSLIVILHQHKLMDFKELEDILAGMVRDTSAYNINIYYLFERIFSKRRNLKA
jgi:hypothetical protein